MRPTPDHDGLVIAKHEGRDPPYCWRSRELPIHGKTGSSVTTVIRRVELGLWVLVMRECPQSERLPAYLRIKHEGG